MVAPGARHGARLVAHLVHLEVARLGLVWGREGETLRVGRRDLVMEETPLEKGRRGRDEEGAVHARLVCKERLVALMGVVRVQGDGGCRFDHVSLKVLLPEDDAVHAIVGWWWVEGIDHGEIHCHVGVIRNGCVLDLIVHVAGKKVNKLARLIYGPGL